MVFVALGAGLLAQQLVVRPRHAGLGWVLFAAAGVLFAATTRFQPRHGTVPVWAGPVVDRRRLVWAIGAIAAVVATVWLSARDVHAVPALLLWVVGFGFASLALRGSRLSPPARPRVPWTPREAGLLLAILLGGAVARTAWIAEVPRYYFEDEPRVGLMVRDAFRERVPGFFTTGFRSWSAPEPTGASPEAARAARAERHGRWTLASMAIALQAVFAPLFGLNTTALRLGSSVAGTLAILATYLFARELFTPRIALLAGVLFACGRTAIDFSRLGVPPVQVAFFEALAFACWWRAINRGAGLAYLWAGIAMALCLTTYNAAHIVPPLWAGWAALCVLIAPRLAWRYRRGALVTVAAFLLAAAPYLLHITDGLTFGDNWQDYTAGTSDRQVIGNVVEAWQERGAGTAWTIVERQAERTWLGFGVNPAGAYMLGYRGGGMLDHVSAALFVLGLAFAAANLRRPRIAFLLYWWLVTAVVLGVLTAGAPAFLRLTGLLPVLAVLGALPLDSAIRAAPAAGPARSAVLAGVGVLLALMAWDNWRTYFVEFPRQTRHARADAARYLAAAPPEAEAFLAGADSKLQLGAEIFRLDFPGRRFENVGEPSHLLPLRTSAEVPVALLFAPSQLALAEYARTLYPNAPVTDVFAGDDAERMFRALLLSPAEIAARQGLRREVRAGDGRILHAADADPFSPMPSLPAACTEVTWSGSVYWPTDAPVSLTLSGATSMLLAQRVVRARGDDAPVVRVAVQLPRGWHPVTVTETCAPLWLLELTIEDDGISRPVLARDLRPDGAGSGLHAVYRRDARPLLEAIDPVVDYAVPPRLLPTAVGPYGPVTNATVRPPLTASWRGFLEVDTPGTYVVEVASLGGDYVAVALDEEALVEQVLPRGEAPQSVRVTRTLVAGRHPLSVRWQSEATASDSPAQVQLFWTPPGGPRELVPPNHLRYLQEGAAGAAFPRLEVLAGTRPFLGAAFSNYGDVSNEGSFSGWEEVRMRGIGRPGTYPHKR